MSMKKLQFQTPTELNDDLINEIINRLPAISNFRFKCVSKQWFFLNSEALKHKGQNITMYGIFYVTIKGTNTGMPSVKYARTQKGPRNEDPSIDGTLSFLPKHLAMTIYGSCNGLLLCVGWFKNDHSIYLSGQTSCLCVCNPATRKWVKIPYDHWKTFVVTILDFNPRVSTHFSVIRVSRSYRYFFEVFSSKTGDWKVSPVTNPILDEYIIGDNTTSIFRGLVFCLNREYMDIMGFDMKGNSCRRIELPGKSDQRDLSFFKHCGSLGGFLCQSGGYLHYYYKSGNALYIWKLVDYESGSWLLKSKFQVTGILRTISDLKFHPEMDEILLLSFDNKMVSYNMQTTDMVDLCSLHFPSVYFPYSPCYLQGFGNGL